MLGLSSSLDGHERFHAVLEVGEHLPFEAQPWRDVLIVVQAGAVSLTCRSGRSAVFGRGCVLCFSGLDLESVSAVGGEALVILAVGPPSGRASSDSA